MRDTRRGPARFVHSAGDGLRIQGLSCPASSGQADRGRLPDHGASGGTTRSRRSRAAALRSVPSPQERLGQGWTSSSSESFSTLGALVTEADHEAAEHHRPSCRRLRATVPQIHDLLTAASRVALAAILTSQLAFEAVRSRPQHFSPEMTKAPPMAGPPWSNVTLWVDCATLTRLLVPGLCVGPHEPNAL